MYKLAMNSDSEFSFRCYHYGSLSPKCNILFFVCHFPIYGIYRFPIIFIFIFFLLLQVVLLYLYTYLYDYTLIDVHVPGLPVIRKYKFVSIAMAQKKQSCLTLNKAHIPPENAFALGSQPELVFSWSMGK